MTLKEKLKSVNNAKSLASILAARDFTDEDVKNFRSLSNVETVEVHVSKGNVFTNFGRADILTNSLTKEENTLLDKNGKSDVILEAFPPDIIGKFRSIEESVRRKRRECSIGNSSYMDEASFNKFLPFFNERLKEFEIAKEELKATYDSSMKQYRKDVTRLIPKIAPQRSKEILSDLNRQTCRSADSFLSDFSMRLSTSFRDSVVDDDSLVELLRKQRNMQVYDECQTILSGLIKSSWEIGAKYMAKLKRTDLATTDAIKKGKSLLLDAATKLRSANFLNVSTFTLVADEFERISNISDRSDALEDIYMVLVYIYGSAYEASLMSSLDVELISGICTISDLKDTYDELTS